MIDEKELLLFNTQGANASLHFKRDMYVYVSYFSL